MKIIQFLFIIKMFITDPIYGPIKLTGIPAKIINTVEFDRLSLISQLGNVFKVYHGATHTRKSHSIGTAYLAQEWLKYLDIEARKSELIITAALCHDIGHIAFSHLLDDCLLQILDIPNNMKTHESRSIRLLKIINKKYSLGLLDEEFKYISNLILGTEKDFNIISNIVDCDRIDYLLRDSHYTGIPVSFRKERIFLNSRVIDNVLTFDRKIANDIALFLENRKYFHSEIYQHKTVLKYNIMLLDYIKQNPKLFPIKEMMLTDTKWLLLTDAYVWSTLYEHSEDSNLGKKIIDRDLYKCVVSDVELKDKIPILVKHIDIGGDNPFSKLKFYNKANKATKCHIINKENISTISKKYSWNRYVYCSENIYLI